MPLPSETDVLIVGAGPSGLALATCLAGHGIRSVVLERLPVPPEKSRAGAIHARTLEMVEPLGVADALVGAGHQLATAVLRDRDTILMQLDFSQIPSRYGYVLALPQNETEAILADRLAALGGTVHRGQDAVGLEQDSNGATVTVRDASGRLAMVRARFVVGADGFHSMVRQAAGIGFTPGTYPESFVLADVHMDWPSGGTALNLFLGSDGMMLVAPFRDGRFRVIATVAQAPEHPSQADLQALLDERGSVSAPARIDSLIWSSRFRIHHGVAATYRAGRAFLVGDAAHVHSPAGGQGMNTGIQDAVVLGDRLAAVIAGDQPDTALDGYGAERRPVAQGVVKMTDQMTRVATLTSPMGRRLRNLGLHLAGHVPTIRTAVAVRMAELRQ